MKDADKKYDDFNESSSENERRISINVRIDPLKFAMMEQRRITGYAHAQTTRNRSDIVNELIGLGLNVAMLQEDLGARDFEKVWTIITQVDWKRFNIANLEKLIGNK